MPVDRSREIEIIVNALQHVGDLVMEVSREQVITRTWCKQGSVLAPAQKLAGQKINEISNDSIIGKTVDKVDAVFANGEDCYIEYTTLIQGNIPATFGIRILNSHPDKEFLFIVVSILAEVKHDEIVEDKWKLALDASGDGVWDMNLETKTMFCSDKWHDIFGYSAVEITTIDQWNEKLHPDDRGKSLEKFEQYLAGNTSCYSNEIRYQCKDGSWKWIQSRGVVIARDSDGKPVRFIGTHTDINKRKLAEEKYASTAQLLAKLINNLQTGIIVTDENWRIIFFNDMFREMYISDGNAASLIGLNMKQNLEKRKLAYKNPEKFRARTVEIFEKGKMVLNEEWEMADGRILVRDFIPLSLGSNSKGGIWKFSDITEQRNVEKRFDEQRLFYERILNNIPADIAVFDAEHRYLFVNKNAFKNDALRKWMIGKTDVDYAQYSNRSYSFVEARQALYKGAMNSRRQFDFIEKLTTKEGKVGHHLRLVHPVYYDNGSFEFLMAYGLEITDLIVAQEELKTSIDTFASAFDHSGIGMALISTNGMWLNANKVLCDLTGYTKEQLLHLTYQQITYPADVEIDRPLINQLLNKEISTYTIDKRYVSKDNKIVLVSLTVSLVWNGDVPRFFIAQVVNITEKKALENDIRRKNMEREATRISLVNKITQLEELSHIIAHNLRGPAGNLKMFAEILLAQHSGISTSDNPLSNAFTIDELVQFIFDSSVSLMDSLSTLMEITEIKLNKEIPYNDCDVSAIINGIAIQLQSIIYEKKAHLKFDLEIEVIKYPRAYMENILYNLVSNALKYSNSDLPPEIIITTRILKNTKTQIIVKDNGLGIDLDKYGDKVFKLNQIFHAGYDSKGVGLYITKTQIESLGGNITLKSRPGEGCEFTVTL